MKEQFVMGSNLCESEKLEQSTGKVPENFLNNIHNCVMFAVCVITSQIHLWRYLDRTTLKLLANNERLILFSSSFATDLNLLYQNKDVPIKYELHECTISTIIFEIKTDNRDNFTDLHSFSKFRKQRDMFYELWREKNIELTPNKVLCILSLSREPVNMAHLARLVCCQLISDILNKKNQDPEVIEDGLSLGITKDKLSLLEARLKQPQRKEQGIPRPSQQFPDKQKFYKDFFEITCENVFFREHVINYLITKILELDNRNFEMDDPDNKEEATKEFEQTVLSLCVLAKFLGLIVFLPFRIPISSEFSNFIFDDQLAVRKKVQPLIDLNMNLQNAIKQRTLVKTVPWIIEYLGMMDLVSLHLPCHRSLLNTLIKIYQSLCPCLNTEINSNILNKADIKLILNEENNKICKLSLLFLRLVLGWLFDFSFFPEPLFSCLRESPDNLGFKLYSGDTEEINCSLDTAEVVSESLIFQLCPYFTHFKYLLISNEKDGSVRHITPVTAHRKLQLISEGASEQELKLEDSFLKGQVASFQNTIEFVKDRVASACIKYICSIIILKRKQEALAKFESFYKTDMINKDAISEYAENLKMEIDSTIAGYCEPRIHKSFEALLGPELVDQNLINIALKIATRKCKEKIVDWLSSHINPTDIFTKVAEQISNSSKDIRKQIQNLDSKTEGKSLTFGSPISRIINLKALIFQIIELQLKNLDSSTVINTLKDLQIKDTLYHPLLTSMSVDFLLILVTYQPLLVTEAVLEEFGFLWTSINVLWKSSCNPLRRLICSRNIMLFCQHYDRKASWDALSRFIVFILSKRFLTIEEFEDQCVIVFRQVWPRTVLKHISSCLKSTLEKVKQENICLNNSKTMLMIELVSETSQDLDDDQR
uniref:Codanin-1 C-terminal domain-containing protein n=1 Tax=Clastoptera arizonana TaxID=38151 RepID=A0A1B6CCG1_9HEMI